MKTCATALVLALQLNGYLVSAQSPSSDTPFADAVARSVAAVFDVSKDVELRGVVATPLMRINRAGAAYFRMTVTDETGRSLTWAVLVRNGLREGMWTSFIKLEPGATVTVRGWMAKDESPRVESAADKISLMR